MRNILLLIFIVIVGCKQNRESDLIATINGTKIHSSEIDSIASSKIYELKKEILKTKIRSRVLELEANSQKISSQELVKRNIENKSNEVTEQDYKMYVQSNNLTEGDLEKASIYKYIKLQKVAERYNVYTDSLILRSDLNILLTKQFPSTVKLEEIKYFDLSPDNKNIVYIISDFDCPHCKVIEPKIEKLINSYSDSFNFRYVFFSDFISSKALAINAVSRQINIKELYSSLFELESSINDSILFDIVENQGIDMNQFKKDYNSSENLKEFLQTKKYLIDHEIYSTPTFVINNTILDDEFAIYQLKNILENETK